MTSCPHRLHLLLVSSATLIAACEAAPQSESNQAAFAPKTAPLARTMPVSQVTPGTARQAMLEQVAQFSGPMPTGIAVSHDNRIFLSFPRWADPVRFTVAELRDGMLEPFPNGQVNNFNAVSAGATLVSVQSVVFDGRGRLWLLDSGNINMGPNLPDGPKLVGVDISDNHVVQTIHFPADVAKANSYLNDVRFDAPGVNSAGGFAYITDSSTQGANGIIVVDLTSGRSWRKLDGDKSVAPEADFRPMVEGQPLMTREPGQPAKPLTIGSDGIALSPDGKTLYYRALAGHHLYSIDTALLRDETAPAEKVSAAVKDLEDLGFASDGMVMDGRGMLYLTDYEHHAIHYGDPATAKGHFAELISDTRLIWPDTLAIGPDNYLYVTVNQLDRQPQYHNGEDLRKPPYALFRVHLPGGTSNVAEDRP